MKRSLSAIVAHNIRKFRIEHKMSQEKLAEYCDLHRTFIGSVERGERNITLNTLESIANGLGVDIVVLVSEDEEWERKWQKHHTKKKSEKAD